MKHLSSWFERHVHHTNFRLHRGDAKLLPPTRHSKPPVRPTRIPSGIQSEARKFHINARLEDLPSELRRQILCLLDLEGLRSLIQATPVFLQQFLLNRRTVLFYCLQSSLGPAASVAYLSSSTLPQRDDTDWSVPEIIMTSRAMEGLKSRISYGSTEASSFGLKNSVSEEEIAQMAGFHRYIVVPLVQLFARETLTDLSREAGQEIDQEPYTETEWTRLTCAFYRFQLFCNILALEEAGESHLWDQDKSQHRLLQRVVCSFEPWEMEEVACIHSFVRRKYAGIFDDIHGNFDHRETRPKRRRLEADLEAVNVAAHFYEKSRLLEGTICQGLVSLQRALFQQENQHHLLSFKQRIMSIGDNSMQMDILGIASQAFRRHAFFTERDWKEQRREPMTFEGDDAANYPLAWTLLWDGTWSNKYGQYIPETLRRWGYVMWDAARIESSGGREVLKRQIDAAWGDQDPRYGGL